MCILGYSHRRHKTEALFYAESTKGDVAALAAYCWFVEALQSDFLAAAGCHYLGYHFLRGVGGQRAVYLAAVVNVGRHEQDGGREFAGDPSCPMVGIFQ